MHFNNTLRNRLKMEDPGLGSMTFNLLRATCRRILLWVMVNPGVPGLKNSLDCSSWTASRFIPLCKHFIYLFRTEKNNNINIWKTFLVPISENWKWRIYLQYWHRFRCLLSTKQVLFSSNRKKGGKLLFLDLVVVYITNQTKFFK